MQIYIHCMTSAAHELHKKPGKEVLCVQAEPGLNSSVCKHNHDNSSACKQNHKNSSGCKQNYNDRSVCKQSYV
jgi:hypothetical protein